MDGFNSRQARSAHDLRLQDVAETFDDLIVALDHDYRVMLVNSSFARAFNTAIGRDLQIGDNLLELISHTPGLKSDAVALWSRAFEGEAVQVERAYAQPDGSQRIYRLSFAPLAGDSRERAGAVLVVRDLTELRDAERRQVALQEEMLRRTGETLRLALSTGRMGAWDWKLSENVVYWTEGHFALLGLRQGEVEPSLEAWRSRLHPDDHDRVMDEFNRARAQGAEYLSEHRIIWPDGTAHWLEARGTFIRDDQGEVERMVGVLIDIEEKKASELALRASETLFRNMIYGASIPMMVYAVDGEVLHLNNAWLESTGYSFEDLPTVHHWMDLAYGRNPEVRALIDDAIRHHRHVRPELSLKTKNGEQRTFLFDSCPLGFLPDGREARMTAGLDITHRISMERALHESRERLRAAMEAAETGTFRWNIRTSECFFDEQLARLFGLASADQVHTLEDVFHLIHEEDRDAMRRRCEACAETGADFHMAYRVRWPDGSIHWLDDKGKVIRDEHGRVSHMTGACVDITRQKESEQRLVELNETLEQRVFERTAAFKKRSAQLRYLASEMSRIEQKERQRLADVLHNHLQQIIAASLMRLDVLDRKLQKSEQHLLLKEASDLLREAVAETRSLTTQLSPPILQHSGLGPALEWLGQSIRDQHGLQVHVTLEPNVEPEEEELRALLFEAARELLFNVVKHAHTREAWLTLSRADSQTMRVVVADAGVGAAVDSLRSKEEAPAGFGLFSISERLSIYGGELNITSSGNDGFTVEMLAPLRSPRKRKKRNESLEFAADADLSRIVGQEPESARIRLLVVDDHAIVREGIVSILQEQLDFLIVGEARDGLEAVTMARTLKPQVVVMDVNMPRLNGIEATRQIKSEFPDLTVIGLSVNNDEGTARAMREAGADAYLPKDGPSEDLCDVIRISRGAVRA